MTITYRFWQRLRIMLACLLSLALASCQENSDYRYKLSLVVNDNGRRISGYNVVDVHVVFSDLLVDTIQRRPVGEALVLDLGKRRVLVAALRRKDANLYPKPGEAPRRWGENAPFVVLLSAYGIAPSEAARNSKDWKAATRENLRSLRRQRGARPLPFSDLPDLLTFSNPDDPKTVQAVDPNNLAASFGNGVRLESATIEITDEKRTSGIEKKLPWLPGIRKIGGSLTGERWKPGAELANQVNGLWFQQ